MDRESEKRVSLDFEQALEEIIGIPVAIRHVGPVSGGDINDAYRIDTEGCRYFLKVQQRSEHLDLLEKEARGLDTLRGQSSFYIPEVIGHRKIGRTQYLLLEWLDMSSLSKDGMASAGEALAQLHSQHAETFGWSEDNYLATIVQDNSWNSNVSDFFADQRLRPLLRLAIAQGKMNGSDVELMEQLIKRLPDLLPATRPSLLHGDLWSGNIAQLRTGQPCIYDPAVYYGHPEQDLAMTRLFGGFDEGFYKGYMAASTDILPDWPTRVELWNLYPLMLHLVLFGGGYYDRLISTLERYV